MKRTPVQNGKPGGKGFEKPGSLTTENRHTEVGLPPVTASLSILVYGSGYALPSSLLLVLFDAPRLVDVLQELAQLQDTEVSQRFFDFV
jgi:hypothetical protein